MEAEELDQIVSAVAETVNTQFGARLDALEQRLSESAVAEPPAPATDEPAATEEPVAEEPAPAEEPVATEEPAATNDLSSIGTPEEVAAFRAYQAEEAEKAENAKIDKRVSEALSARGHTITPASPSKPAGAGASEDANDPRAAYAKEFEAKTKIPFDLAFAAASERSRMLSAPEALMVNAHLRNHGKPPVAA